MPPGPSLSYMSEVLHVEFRKALQAPGGIEGSCYVNCLPKKMDRYQSSGSRRTTVDGDSWSLDSTLSQPTVDIDVNVNVNENVNVR